MSTLHPHAMAILPAMIDGEWLGFTATVVQEVLPAGPWVAVPGASDQTPGIAFWRGKPIAVVDIKALRGRGKALVAGVTRARLLIALAGSEPVAVPVDAAREVRHVWETGEAATPIDSGPSARIRDVGRRAAPLVDVEALLTSYAGASAAKVGQLANPAAEHETSTHVVLRGATAHWALPAARVQRMLSIAESAHIRCLDLFRLLMSAAPKESAASRALVLSSAGKELAVRVPGDIAFRRLVQAEIHPLPDWLRRLGVSATICGVCETEEQVPLFVVDADVLSVAAETLGEAD